MLSPKTNEKRQEDERELMGETGTVFRDLGQICVPQVTLPRVEVPIA